MTEEEKRLLEAKEKTAHWRQWGPYLSERQWGTVREDYSASGNAWDYFTHDQARSRTYRWGEDGLAGISDNHQRLCFALALWNGKDPYLKERLFGLTGNQGNHGEDVKEYYYYLDNTPTHSYMKFLYKYPQSAYPYDRLVTENHLRDRTKPEFELIDTGIFDDDRYFDIFVEYAKGSADDILIDITVWNRGPESHILHLLPTLWFRNSWVYDPDIAKPCLKVMSENPEIATVSASHPELGQMQLYCEAPSAILFTENETNYRRLFGKPNSAPYVKDGINDYIIVGKKERINLGRTGTKCSPHYLLNIGSGKYSRVRLRLNRDKNSVDPLGKEFDAIFQIRKQEADLFYEGIMPETLSDALRTVQRQAFAGMLWSKQFYYYVVEDWLKGDERNPPPPEERKRGRNAKWIHLYNNDIISMPDKWEYPWYASWDLAFHLIPFAMIDPEFAKNQLVLLTREWYMHPNGQIPAYEWDFRSVNPPVHAWAAWRIYKIDKKRTGKGDTYFLERVFQKLLLNFTWWVNRKDMDGSNIFEGGFLGLDNIGVFDRNVKLLSGGRIEQSDGTSWMGMYCLNMLTISLELAKTNPSYEDIASKFFEHFLYIAHAMNAWGEEESGLWDEEDGFYYDALHLPDGQHMKIKLRSMVGLIPLFAIETIEPDLLNACPGFKKRLEWFIKNRPDLAKNIASMEEPGVGQRRILSIVSRHKLRRILHRMLDETRFLSPYGIRSLSKFHKKNPYIFNVDGQTSRVDYEPAESGSTLFGGNSNWRGPIWFPLNYLIIESLQKFHHYLGNDYKVECPTGSGKDATLWEVATEISNRLVNIFLKDRSARRPLHGDTNKFQTDPNFKDYILFYEYFHGDNGAGLGASHQTGWTGLIAKLIAQYGEYALKHKPPSA
ncbi:MAG: glucosidase [Nitrospirae bacterium]|nr:glucosidase [Candidatus Troglogloeales bacterium]